MKIDELSDDILSLIEEKVKKHPKYRFKKVIQEIDEIGEAVFLNLTHIGLHTLLDAPPFTFAEYYHPDNGGFWFKAVNDRDTILEVFPYVSSF